MYIYKMTDSSGTFIGSSVTYPSTADLRYSKQLSKMKNPKVTVIRDNVNKDTVQLEMFNESINEILSSDTYDLLNGRFHSIESVMEYMGRHFILVVACKTTKKVYIADTYNPVEKLYRIFVSHRGRAELVNDVINEGKDNFTVDIISTFDNPYHEMLRMFKSYIGKGYDIYNEGTYNSLKSAAQIVEKISDINYIDANSNDNYMKLIDIEAEYSESDPDEVSHFDEPDDGSWLTE